MEKISKKKKVIVFTICLILSFSVWIYITNIENPIQIQDISKVEVNIINSNALKNVNLTLAPDQTFNVNLKIQGTTQNLSKISKTDFKVTVDLSNLALKTGLNTVQANVTEAPKNILIKNKENLTIDLFIDELIEKEFVIESGIDVIAKPYFYVAPPIFNPEKTKVTGPSSIINKIAKVKAIGSEENISETTLKNYQLQAVDENNNIINGVNFSDKWTQGTIKVNEGKSVLINIKTKGIIKDGFKILSINQSKTKIKVTGPAEDLNSLENINTKEIDISKIESTSEITAELDLPKNIYVNRGDETLTVTFNVEERKSVEFNLSYKVVGLKSNLKINPKSDTIKIKVHGYEEELKKITEENIKIEFNVSNITEPGTYSLTPNITTENIILSKPIEILEELQFDISK